MYALACVWLLVCACLVAAKHPGAPTATHTSLRAATPTTVLQARADDDTLQAGGITITEPAQTAQQSFYKIAPHESITFGWQFTSLTKTPARLFVAASCSANGNTYPIAPSPSGIPGDATAVTWYPYGYRLDAQAHGQPDLVAATYRLIVYDENGPDHVPRGGEFQVNNMAQFALYFPQAYTPLSDWSCNSCKNGAWFAPAPALLGTCAALAFAVVAGLVCL